MAKNIKINGVTYNGVKDIDVPLSIGGGTAKFMETSDATADASDIAIGATAYAKDEKVVGTLDISGKADKVSGGTTDFLAKLDAEGNLANSLYKSPMQHTIYSSTSGWTKILSWPFIQDCTIRIRGYAGRGYYEGRGHWEILFCVSSGENTHRADLVMATHGVGHDKFDIRLVGEEYTFYFNVDGWSHWRIVVDRWRVFPAVFQLDEKATPTGTKVPMFWPETGSVKLDGDTMTGQLNAPIIRATADTDASLSSTGHGFQIGSTDKANIAMDGNEIMARNNGAASILYLNSDGGDVRVNGNSIYRVGSTIPVADGGTGGTTAASARAGLNIRHFKGTCYIAAAGRNYGTVTMAGVTASSVITGVVSGAQVASGWAINSISAGSGQATIYFNSLSTAANQGIAVQLISVA